MCKMIILLTLVTSFTKLNVDTTTVVLFIIYITKYIPSNILNIIY